MYKSNIDHDWCGECGRKIPKVYGVHKCGNPCKKEETKKNMYKGQLEGFPKEVVEKMLERQVEQGNERNVEVFEKIIDASAKNGGFYWDKTTERFDFWSKVITFQNFDLFFKKYPKNEYPKVMLVRQSNFENWYKRVVFMEKCGKFLTWSGVETIEASETIMSVSIWEYAKEIEEPKIIELTIEEIAKAMNLEPNQIRIKD